jgi:hypothetical protein
MPKVAVVAAGRQVIGGAVLPHGLDPARLGIGDRDEAELDLTAVMREPDHVGGVKSKARGRQAEGRGLAADPGFHQRAAAAAFSLFGGNRHGEGLGRDAGGVHGDAAGLDEGCVIVLVGTGNLPLQRLRQLREDDIGRAAPGRGVGRAHLRGDEGIGRLGLIARIPAPGDAGHVHRLAVGPDAADAGDSPPCRASSASILSTGENGPSGTGFGAFAERHGEAGRIEIFSGLHSSAAALATALRGGPGLLAEIGRPDDVAADAHAPVEARDDGALGRGADAQLVEPSALDPLRRGQRRHDPAVDRRADGRADEAADGGPGKAEA